MVVRSMPALAPVVLLPLLAYHSLSCSSSDDEAPVAVVGRGVYDVSRIDITGFTTDPLIQRRILDMPFGEAAARLGSLSYDARSRFEFSRGEQQHAQADLYKVNQDPMGNFEVTLTTPRRRIELTNIGNSVYVRQDRGKVRRKHQHNVEMEQWTELAWGSLRECLELFGPRLQFADPRPKNVAGRQATRYTLSLAPEAKAAETPPEDIPVAATDLPVAAPAGWREQAKALDLKGQIAIDVATGVLLSSELDARFEVADRDVHPTELTIDYESSVSNVGKVATIMPPKGAVPEFTRKKPPRDLLGFFRDQLPSEGEAPEEK